MVEHIVLFKLKESTDAAAAQAMMDALASLKEKIGGIADLTVGENFSPERAKGFTHGLAVRFQSRSDLDAYLPHPAHQEVVGTYIKPILDDLIVVDYET